MRCGAPQGHTGGEGVTYDYENVPSFQITVYVPRTTRPTWYERGHGVPDLPRSLPQGTLTGTSALSKHLQATARVRPVVS